MPRVLNKAKMSFLERANAVYVGRPSKWGNPFIIGVDGTRLECIEQYRKFVADKHEQIRAELRGKDLICWCAPMTCHADVLLEIANAEETE